MNREIKFRCFDSLSPKMYTGHSLTLQANGTAMFLEDTGEWVEVDPEAGRIIVMQFTGLKDKNGKEIYEGDILKDPQGGKWLVVWEESKGAFMIQEIKKDKKVFDGRFGPMRINMQRYIILETENLGNHLEHPHLLTP